MFWSFLLFIILWTNEVRPSLVPLVHAVKQSHLGLFLFILFSFIDTNVQLISPISKPAHPISIRPFGSTPIDRFLDTIRSIESNRGKHTNHVLMRSGAHRGTSAIGQWGIMPLTVIAALQANKHDKRLRYLRGMSVYAINDRGLTIEEQIIIARWLGKVLLSISNGDERLAAYRWYNGGYTKPSAEELDGSEYVQRYDIHRGITCFKCGL